MEDSTNLYRTVRAAGVTEQSERRKRDSDMDELKAQISDIAKRTTDVQVDIAILGNKIENLHRAKNDNHAMLMHLIEKHNISLYGDDPPGITLQLHELKGIPAKVNSMELKMATWAGAAVAIVFIIKFALNI